MQHFTLKTPIILRGVLSWLFAFVVSYSMLAQQSMPITGSLQINSPYPANWSEYAVTGASRMGLNLTLNEAELGSMNVRLKLYIEYNNTLIATSSDVVTGVPTLNLVPFITKQLGALDLNPYFRFENLQGFSTLEYQKPLENGVYRISFQVVNAVTGQRLSEMIGQSMFITLNDPPQLTQPSRGEQIAPTSGSNLTFQWLSRATTALPLQYEWTVIEVPFGTTNVNALWATAPILYQATVATNAISRPTTNFTSGKTYAWRIQAKLTSGMSLFRNNGFSETFTFQMGSTCPAISGLLLTPKASDVIAISWTGAAIYYNYRVAYRKYSTTVVWEWVEQVAINNTFNLTGLEADTEYEVRVGGMCANGATSFCTPLRATTLALGQIQGLNCGQMPPLPAAGTPIASLAIGDVIMSGDFPVTLTKVAGGNGNFTGEGWVKIPWMGSTKIKVTFANIGVNTEKKLTSGFLQTAYDPNWGNIANIDGVFEGGTNVGIVRTGLDTSEFSINFPINGINNIAVTINSSGGATIVITGSSGQSQSITTSSLPTTIKDSQGRIYGVDKNGVVFVVGQQVAINMSSSELNTFSDKGKVVFSQHGFYAFDAYNADYDKDVLWKAKYEKIGAYGVARKVAASGKPDVLKAQITLTDNTFKADSVKFINGKGMCYKSKALSSGVYEINIVGGPAGDAQEIYALYPKSEVGKYWSLGKILVAAYQPQKRKLILVPVNGATFDRTAIAAKVNQIYNPVCVEWEVIQEANFQNNDWDKNRDGVLDVGNTGLLSALTPEMIALNKAYKTGRALQDGIYLFVLDRASSPTTAGDMPRGKQFGYLFKNTNLNLGQVAAHEIGHGYFKLKHTFDRSYSFNQDQLADNLMNYKNGLALSKYQWDQIHDTGLALGLFDDDNDNKYETDGHFSTVYLVSLMLGLGEQLSYDLAKYAELPDTRIHDEVHFQMDDTWKDQQTKTHSLTAGFHGVEELMTALAFMYTKKEDVVELGRLLHRFGDSYAHTRLNNLSDWSTVEEVNLRSHLPDWLTWINNRVTRDSGLKFLNNADMQRQYLNNYTLDKWLENKYMGGSDGDVHLTDKYKMYGNNFLWVVPFTFNHLYPDGPKPDFIYLRPKWYLIYVKNLAQLISAKYDTDPTALDFSLFEKMTRFASSNTCSLKGIIDYEISKKLNRDYVVIPAYYASIADYAAYIDDAVLNDYSEIAKAVKDKTIKYIRDIDNKQILRVEEIHDMYIDYTTIVIPPRDKISYKITFTR